MHPTFYSIRTLLEVDELAPQEQEALTNDLVTIIFEDALFTLVERIDDSTRQDIDTFLDTTPSEEELTSYLTSRVPGMGDAVEEALARLYDDILVVTGQ